MRRIEQQAFVQRSLDYGVGRIVGQIEPPEQPLPTQFAVTIAMGQTTQAFAQMLSGFPHMIDKALVLHAVEHDKYGGTHQRIAMMSAAHFADFETTGLASRQQCRQWHATTEPFAEHHDICPHTVGLFGKQCAAATDAGLHFVKYQQNAKLTTQALDALEVVLGSGNHPGLALDRFEHDRDRLGIHGRMQGGQVIERDMAEGRQLWLESVDQIRTVRRRNRPEATTMTAFTGHNDPRSAATMLLAPFARQFDRRFTGFAATVEQVRLVTAGTGAEPVGEVEHAAVVQSETRIDQRLSLLRNRFDQC